MRLPVLVLCATLFVPVAGAYSAPPAPSSAPVHTRSGLTPEEHFLYMKEQRGPDWRKLSMAQRCDRIQKIRREKRDMKPAELRSLKQRLDAEWNKLPAAEKQRIEQHIARHRERRAEGKPRDHERRCALPQPAD